MFSPPPILKSYKILEMGFKHICSFFLNGKLKIYKPQTSQPIQYNSVISERSVCIKIVSVRQYEAQIQTQRRLADIPKC